MTDIAKYHSFGGLKLQKFILYSRDWKFKIELSNWLWCLWRLWRESSLPLASLWWLLEILGIYIHQDNLCLHFFKWHVSVSTHDFIIKTPVIGFRMFPNSVPPHLGLIKSAKILFTKKSTFTDTNMSFCETQFIHH
jgi:hypothetical protein